MQPSLPTLTSMKLKPNRILSFLRLHFPFSASPKIRKLTLVSLLMGCFLLFGANTYVENAYSDYVFDSLEELPANQVGLLLGTSKFTQTGLPNPFFYNRIEAAATLYHFGKIKYVLVSGDNNTQYYNEPRDMKNALIALGVPKEVIYMDFAGFRTLDSVVRCHKVFGQQNFTIISQDFHAKRAVYISRIAGLHAIGYTAKDISIERSLIVKTRELFARVKALLDVHLFDSQPKFLGKKIQIGQV